MTTHTFVRFSLAVLTSVSLCACQGLQSPSAPSFSGAGALEGTSSLHGYVVDATLPTSNGIGGVNITVGREGVVRRAISKVDGEFAFYGLGSGDWILTIDRDGQPLFSELVHVDGDTERTFAVDLTILGPVPVLRSSAMPK